ncbi:hypothetical protein AB0395_22025 [Streptosporangium sp. NPDC051023]|uniref:hypothetical protein n=1 Tax=Streptosporangium sp. NPDC051023 TaxID=3155410 RepID=UPI00344ECBEE
MVSRSPRPTCTRHRVEVDGGPVQYWCPNGHGLTAADLDNEFHPAPALQEAGA